MANFSYEVASWSLLPVRYPLAENEKVLMGAPFAHLRFEQRPEDASAVPYLGHPGE